MAHAFSDLADAHVRALERFVDGLDSAAINLGTGRDVSLPRGGRIGRPGRASEPGGRL